jgi:mRNA-degrading endonuclease RelE of RelBE toxin-antitoxin system
VRYTVVLTDDVKDKLRALPPALRREIGHKLFLLEEDLGGNVKKLKGSRNQYRPRVRHYRVLFELEGRTATCMLWAVERISTDVHRCPEIQVCCCKPPNQHGYR